VITCLLVFAAIAEMIGKRRAWLLGVLFALVLATRVTAAIGVLWPIGEILRTSEPWRKKLRSVVAIALPILVVAALLMAYNQARFNNAFDQGYAEQIIPPHADASRALGIFSLHHLPGNLYALLLAPPSPVRRDNFSLILTFPYVVNNPWGTSLWVTSPLFLCLIGLRHRDATSQLLLLATLVIAVPILLYYGNGFRQFGYRYSLDFLPFLYYLLLRNYRDQRGDLTVGFKAVIIFSAIWNFYLFAGYFWWHIGW
jgi:AcrR family transcriptional regulator